MADGAWTRYKLQRKIFSIGEDFWIENERGESVFKFDGKALSLRDKFVLEDQGGAELVSVEKKLISLQPTMKIERQSSARAACSSGLTMASALAASASRSLLQYHDQFQPPLTAPPQPRIGP